MIKLGLTGGICTGKSLVLSFFNQLGAFTMKADALSKKILFGNDPSLRQQILEAIGFAKNDHNPSLTTENLSQILFSNPDKRLIINNIVHPKVSEERKKLISTLEKDKKHLFFLYESALLVEAGTYREFDRVLVVYCSPEQQLERLMKRDNLSRSEAAKRIKSQLPLSEKLKIAHYTIDTGGTVEQTYAKTQEIFSLVKRDFNIA